MEAGDGEADEGAEAEAKAEVSSHREPFPPTEAQVLRSLVGGEVVGLQERQVPSKSLLERV